MTLPAVGLRSLAVHFPRAVRTNDYWREQHPDMVRGVADQNLARVWSTPKEHTEDAVFLAEMAPYLSDPFRGAVARRILAPDESALSMELPAARAALDAAKMGADEVDLLIASAFLPDQFGVGNAAFIANALGLRCPAWNLETACSSALVAFETACAMIRGGGYPRVLVVVSCAYSKANPDTDTLSWSIGDGATAFVVGRVPDGEGVLGMKTINTADKCDAMHYELVADEGGARPIMRAGKDAGASLRITSKRALVTCCEGAARAAGVSLDDIDFFAVPTPMAWYAGFCAKQLGFAPEKTFNVHPRYANVGPVLMPANLFHAAAAGKVRPGDLVMLHTVGSVSNASAAVVRWGDVGLGPMPA